jgi:flagellar export protein FliJ
MAKFQFRLATLLRLREDTRDERRAELAEVQRADDELHACLMRVQAEQRQLQNECRKAAAPGLIDISRLAEAEAYAATLREQEAGLQRKRETLAIEIERRRTALLEAEREVQTLEKLREHQADAYRQEEDRREGKRLDEAALQTAAGR